MNDSKIIKSEALLKLSFKQTAYKSIMTVKRLQRQGGKYYAASIGNYYFFTYLKLVSTNTVIY